MQTYEAADYRASYARAMELAGNNLLFPEHASFALPVLEVGDRSTGSSQTTPPHIPPVLLKAIAWIESGWAQGSYDPFVPYGSVGPTLVSHDCGYGIMQVTSGMQNITGVPNLDQVMVGGHYGFNIARGARILADKWNQSPEFRPLVGNRDPHIIENWYYALWGYNGFVFKNHPLNPVYDPNRPPFSCGPENDGLGHNAAAYPYQERVMGCAAHPPVRGGIRLWEPVDVTLPNRADPAFAGPLSVANWEPCALSLVCGPMDLPIPPPYHQDLGVPSMTREQIFGAPTMAVSQTSLGFSAIPGSDSLGTRVSVVNSGSGVMAWRVVPTASWIRLDRSQGVSLGGDLGSVTQDFSVQASAYGLVPGTYTAEVVVESLFAWGTPIRIPVTLTVSLQAGASTTADFTGDGKTDVAFLCCADYVSMLISSSNGSFSKATYRPWPGYAMTAGTWQAANLNGDGMMDLIHFCCEGFANRWISQGNGSFAVQPFSPWQGYGTTFGSWLGGDFNGDGRTDFLHNWSPQDANVWVSSGDGFVVKSARPWDGYNIAAGSWQPADVNGDGKTDLVHLCCPNYANVWLSSGDGNFTVTTAQAWPGYDMQSGPWQAGDTTGDGKADLLHLCCPGYVNTWVSRGDGSFAVAPFTPWPGYDLTAGFWMAGDINADGRAEPLHLCCGDYINSWVSNSDGTFGVVGFRPWPSYNIGAGYWQPGDFDGDGRLDLMHLCCSYVNIWRSNGAGQFSVSAFHP